MIHVKEESYSEQISRSVSARREVLQLCTRLLWLKLQKQLPEIKQSTIKFLPSF